MTVRQPEPGFGAEGALVATRSPIAQPEIGPYRVHDLRPGDRYELIDGHRVYCAPAGGSHSTPNALGAAVVGADPNVREHGVDTGFTRGPRQLRAPDVAVGNVPNQPGWVNGVPELAIEYADEGQDEDKLQSRIQYLLGGGTKFLWVVRLTGPRRVDVHEPGKPMRMALPGTALVATGVLKNPVLVEALYDRDAANRATLTNLLQREGYEDLAAVLAEGEAKGEAKGLRAAVRDLCELLAVPLTPEREAAIAEMSIGDLEALRARLKRDRRWD